TEDGIAVIRIGKEFHDVAGQKRAVRLGEHEEVAGCLGKAALIGMPIALLRFEDLSGPGLVYFLSRSRLGVVVDDQNLIHHTGGEEAVDHFTDRRSFRVGSEYDRYRSPVPHLGFPLLSIT